VGFVLVDDWLADDFALFSPRVIARDEAISTHVKQIGAVIIPEPECGNICAVLSFANKFKCCIFIKTLN